MTHPAAATAAPSAPNSEAAFELERLLAVMARLRDPQTGCPWDRVQTFETIAPFAIEEAYEVMDAIARQDFDAMADELGDLLLQVVYQARMAEEAGRFDFATIARAIADKMIRRHPHVFSDGVLTPQSWEDSKAAERAATAASDQTGTSASALDGVAAGLPALLRARKLSARAARTGFDWATPAEVIGRVTDELEELRAELGEMNPDRLEDELGDVLFTIANLARKLDLDPEASLRRANAKFTRRFQWMEHAAARAGRTLSEEDLPAQERLWTEAKRALQAKTDLT